MSMITTNILWYKAKRFGLDKMQRALKVSMYTVSKHQQAQRKSYTVIVCVYFSYDLRCTRLEEKLPIHLACVMYSLLFLLFLVHLLVVCIDG